MAKTSEIKRKIGMAKAAFNKLKHLSINKYINMQTKMKILFCNVWSILLYGCETWTLSKMMKNRIESCEM
jgi:hypothetical protein